MTRPGLFAAAVAAVMALAALAAAPVALAVEIEDIAEGDGPVAAAGHRVTVHYDGRLADGTPFDSSRERGQPFVFTLGRGQVIRGWEIGIAGMKPGGERRLTVPPEYGYGDRDLGVIPPGSTLIFDVELLAVE